MTTTNTMDVESTIKQSMKIFDAGSDYVRITAPSIKEAKALKDAKQYPEIVNFLVGKVMQKTRGKADPELTLALLKKNLGID